MRGWLGWLVATGLVAGSLPLAFGQGIFTCVDAKGRRLTSDRPILDCIDREQSEITPNGQVIRKIAPKAALEDSAAAEEQQRRAAEERNRQLEQKRRDRALLSRYPDKAAHERERQLALSSVDDSIHSAQQRMVELQQERKKLDAELEFYKGDLGKAPPQLRRRIDENQQQLAAQQRFIASKDDDKKRINARFDEELARLKELWAGPAGVSRAASSAAR